MCAPDTWGEQAYDLVVMEGRGFALDGRDGASAGPINLESEFA